MDGKGGSVSVVLVRPSVRLSLGGGTPDAVDRANAPSPPLGLLYLHAAVLRSGRRAEFLDAEALGLDHEETAERILAFEAPVLGLTMTSFTLLDAVALARILRRRAPELVVVAGGPHASLFPEETLALGCFDHVVKGEGEESFIHLLENLDNGDLARLEGGASGRVGDLDGLSHPVWSAAPVRRYGSILAPGAVVASMVTSRGCPFDCIYCNRGDRTWRAHGVEWVVEEYGSLSAAGVDEIHLVDDTFTLDRRRAMDIASAFPRGGPSWTMRTRVDLVDDELLGVLARGGCRLVGFGVESGSPAVLGRLRKAIDPDRVRKAFRACRTLGIETLADFMVGSPGEEVEDVELTLRLMEELDPDYVQFSALGIYPGTPLHALAREMGIVHDDPWRRFASDPRPDFRSPLWTERFTEEELRAMVDRAHARFYFRPGFVWKRMRSLKSWKGFKALLRMGLALWRRGR